MKIFPSVLASDFSCPATDIESILESGVDSLHLDVMDGHFVPNISFGFPVIRSIAERFPGVKLDAHLMIENPEQYLDPLVDIGVDWVSVHAEVDPPVGEIADRLRENGVAPGIAINPDTPADQIIPFLGSVDFVLLMTVQPGFGGQSFRDDVLKKITEVSNIFDGPIQVDGGIGPDTIARASGAGADWFVSGSSVFGDSDPGQACRELLEKAQSGREN